MKSDAPSAALAAARTTLSTNPDAFSLPLGLVGKLTLEQLLSLAAVLVLWVRAREQVSTEAAVKLLERDYVFDAILQEAALREKAAP